MNLDACLTSVSYGFCVDYSFAIACLLLGAVAGFIGGLMGVGGGIIIVPVLYGLFTTSGMELELALKMSLATSLATIIFTSAAAIRAQLKHQVIVWPIVIEWTPFILIGSFCTGFVADAFSPLWLKSFLGCFLLVASIVMLLNWSPKPTTTNSPPGKLGSMIISFTTGFTSALVGIGGGNIIIPILTWFNLPIKNTTATSSALGFPIALFGSAGFALSGGTVANLPALNLGYIYLPALVLIAIMTFLFAPLGVACAHRLPANKLKQAFAILLMSVALKMLIS